MPLDVLAGRPKKGTKTPSLRARARPTVSTPVTWNEVERCFEAGDPEVLVFDAAQVLGRIESMGDLFEPVLTLKQKLPKEV